MKIVNKKRVNKQNVLKKPVTKIKKEKVLLVAQEIKFARLLSGNEKKTRDRVLKSLKKWLLNCFDKRYEFKEDDFNRIWKGLFYAVWMSDKPLVQEELCDSIAAILDVFPPSQFHYAILMVKAGLQTLATEWYGIDQHRMDKFLMLVRRYLRGALRCLQRSEWSLKVCKTFTNMLTAENGLFAVKTPTYARNSLSMLLHFADCYLEEMAKVSEGNIPLESLAELLRPFCVYLCEGEAPVVCGACRRLLIGLLRQSELGLRYQLATGAWQRMGCPEGGPEALELVEESDGEDVQNGDNTDEEQNNAAKPLDPRAGRVDVELPLLPVPSTQIVDMLRSLLPKASSKAHRRIKVFIQRFEQLSKEQYPLRVSAADHVPADDVLISARSSARRLRSLEMRLISQSDELSLRGLSRKHRKRLVAKSRAGVNIADEMMQNAQSTNGGWQVKDNTTENSEPNKTQKDTSNKENVQKRKRKQRELQRDGLKKQKMSATSEKKSENVQSGKENIKINGVGKQLSKKDKKQKNSVLAEPKKEVKTLSHVKKTKATTKEFNQKPETAVTNVKTDKVAKTAQNTILKNSINKMEKKGNVTKQKGVSVIVSKTKNFQKPITSPKLDKTENANKRNSLDTTKKVKFVLKNNSMQGTMDYYKSIRQSPSIPFDSTKTPTKTNLKPSTPSPVNPFFKKKLKNKGRY